MTQDLVTTAGDEVVPLVLRAHTFGINKGSLHVVDNSAVAMTS
jgi:hypothetical protein